MFALRRNAAGCIARRSWSCNSAGRAEVLKKKKKKKKRSSLYIIPRHARTCQDFFEKYFCKIFVKFGLSSLEIKFFLWYNRIGERETQNEQTFVSPPNPPIFYYIIKELRLSSVFTKIFLENFFKKCCIVFLFVI